MTQALQAVRRPDKVLDEMLRVGREGIVTFPNFAHWKLRWHLLSSGRMPITGILPDHWYDTPNIHFCTIKDFVLLCEEMGITIERSIALDRDGTERHIIGGEFLANLVGEQAVFLLSH